MTRWSFEADWWQTALTCPEKGHPSSIAHVFGPTLQGGESEGVFYICCDDADAACELTLSEVGLFTPEGCDELALEKERNPETKSKITNAPTQAPPSHRRATAPTPRGGRRLFTA